MAEYKRTINPHTRKIHQWVDAERCVILDSRTGEMQKFGKSHESIGTFEEALDYVIKNLGWWEDRMVIVRLSCVVGFKIDA